MKLITLSQMQTKRQKISIIGIKGLPASYGGFETLADNLCKYLFNEFDFLVYCSLFNKDKSFNKTHFYRRVFLPIKANGVFSIFYDYVSIFHACFNSDKLLILGTSGSTLLPLIKTFFKGKVFINHIDGIEWKRKKWKKYTSFFLKLSEYIAINYSDLVIADNQGIVDYIKENYPKINTKKIKLISYGGDHMIQNKQIKKISLLNFKNEKIDIKEKSYFLSICRIEPENNLEEIIKAFLNLNDYLFIGIGNWNNNNYGKYLLEKYRSHRNIIMAKPIYDIQTVSKIRLNALCYIHGHSAGGTNPSLVEALVCQSPIYAFDVNFNRYTLFNKHHYWKDSESLRQLIIKREFEKINLYKDKNYINQINNNYSWEKITEGYQNIFM
tara:strand:+ start:2151 stop:3299 length:1149 start_codon:yes stop_codon:yes gene_type:complete